MTKDVNRRAPVRRKVILIEANTIMTNAELKAFVKNELTFRGMVDIAQIQVNAVRKAKHTRRGC